MSTPDEKKVPPPAAPAKQKPLTGAALDRALKAAAAANRNPAHGSDPAKGGMGHRTDAPASRIRYIPKRGK